jgi:hypothetical protein
VLLDAPVPLWATGSTASCAVFGWTKLTQISKGNTYFQTCGPLIMLFHAFPVVMQSDTKLSHILEDL